MAKTTKNKSAFAAAGVEPVPPEVAPPTPEIPADLKDRAAAVTQKLTGTPIARELLSSVLLEGVETLIDKAEDFLTKLESYAEDIGEVTAENGTVYRLISLSDLTGWRRREAWKLLIGLASASRIYMANGLDIATVAGEIAGGERGVRLLGLAFGPVGVPYDKDRVEEYGEAVDEVLSTRQITGVILRFFSLSASSILPVMRNSLVSLMQKVLSFADRAGTV